MKQSTFTRISLTFGFVGIILFTGCWTTKVTLIDPATAKVNPAYVGNWDNPEKFDSVGREAGLVIRNIDNKMYYVEWDQKGEAGLVRAVGFVTDVRGATFAQLRGLDADGKIEEEWLLCRLELAGSTLTIRQMNPDFFKDKQVSTMAALRQVLEQNLANEAMYVKDEAITATKK